jgi:flagellar basal body-associated protein FliL
MAEDSDKKSDEDSKSSVFSPQIIGVVFVLLILAGYFVWMTIEMGTAAVSGAAPMVAFLGAAFVGIAAAGAALAIGRKQR